MTKHYQNKLALMKKAENVLPELKDIIVTTMQDDPFVSIGARVNDTNINEADIKEIWVTFTLNPENAAILARKILALVEPDGRLKEKRSITILKST